MKAKHFIVALALGISIMSAPLAKADGINDPQHGNNSVKVCPRGYVRQGDQCVRLEPNNNRADASQSNSAESGDSGDLSGAVYTSFISGAWFYFFGNIG